MTNHTVVGHEQWIAARQALLAKEKAFTRLRDELSRERRALPWERVERDYSFAGSHGTESLGELFAGRSQLIVQHFMLGPDWDEGCKSCSFWADGYNGFVDHLAQRDVAMVTVSRAPLDRIEAFKRRMGWTFKWVSSLGSDFNRDYHVSFTPEQLAAGTAYYNYRSGQFPVEEAPGISVFFRDAAGTIFHTYSCYARGLDMLNAAYHYLDLVPKGRDEDALPYSMSWLRHRDRYGS
jgi:predicted dithiol-disulfide oxidoreductase (DUF899 family)